MLPGTGCVSSNPSQRILPDFHLDHMVIMKSRYAVAL